MDTAREMFAQLVRHYRQAAGSKSACARVIGYSHSHLSRIESGKSLPGADAVRDLDEGLDAGGALIEMARLLDNASRESDTLNRDSADAMDGMETGDVERRQLLQHALGLTGVAGLAGALGRLDAVRATLDDALDRSVDEWQEIAWDYGRDFLALPPADVLEGLSVDVLAVRRLLERPGPPGDRASLQRVAAQLAVLTAATLGDLGEHAHSRRWWRTARTAADRSGDRELAVWVRGRQAARGVAQGYDPDEVVTMAERALALSPASIGAGTTSALAARAQGLAARGDPHAPRAADDVTEAFEQLPDTVTADRASVYGWSQQRLRHVQTYVYSRTGDKKVMDAHDAALAVYPEGLNQEPARVRLYLAAWMARTGDPKEGLRYATRVVNELPRGYRDYQVMVTASDVERALPAGAEKTPEAVEYRELLALSP